MSWGPSFMMSTARPKAAIAPAIPDSAYTISMSAAAEDQKRADELCAYNHLALEGMHVLTYEEWTAFISELTGIMHAHPAPISAWAKALEKACFYANWDSEVHHFLQDHQVESRQAYGAAGRSLDKLWGGAATPMTLRREAVGLLDDCTYLRTLWADVKGETDPLKFSDMLIAFARGAHI